MTGSYDPDLNLTYWGIGNPDPDWNPEQRPGDNLYSDSVVALNADTGELEWYFQFTPNDDYDYDSVQVPVLVDYPAQDGSTVKLMLWGNRNGFFYVLDRRNGQFVSGDPYVFVNWAESLDDNGRPVETPQAPGDPTYPGPAGGTNWYAPSYSPSTQLFYLSAWEGQGSIFEAEESALSPLPRATASSSSDSRTKEGLRTKGPRGSQRSCLSTNISAKAAILSSSTQSGRRRGVR